MMYEALGSTTAGWKVLRAPDGAEASATEPSEGVFEIVDEEPAAETPEAPAADLTLEALKGVYTEMEQRLAGAAANKTDKIADGLASLGQSIKDLVAQKAGAPAETPEEMKERLEKSVFDKPIEVIQEVAQRASGPINEQIIVNQMKMARRLVEVDLEGSERALFKRYKDEIESEFSKMPIQGRFADPEEAYRQAFTMTKARHLGEIIAEERSKLEAEPPKAPARPVGTLEGGPRAAPTAPAAPGGPRIVLKPGQRARIQAIMARENVSPSMFNSVVEALHESGDLAHI